MRSYGSKRKMGYDTEPRMKAGRALEKREGEAEIAAYAGVDRSVGMPVFAKGDLVKLLEESIKDARERVDAQLREWEHDNNIWGCPECYSTEAHHRPGCER